MKIEWFNIGVFRFYLLRYKSYLLFADENLVFYSIILIFGVFHSSCSNIENVPMIPCWRDTVNSSIGLFFSIRENSTQDLLNWRCSHVSRCSRLMNFLWLWHQCLCLNGRHYLFTVTAWIKSVISLFAMWNVFWLILVFLLFMLEPFLFWVRVWCDVYVFVYFDVVFLVRELIEKCLLYFLVSNRFEFKGGRCW